MLTDQTARDAVERMRSDFVANASHELRTPLAAILGFVETLSDPDAGNDPALRTRFLSVIDKEARRMLRLVEDLLSISRIEARKAELPAETHDLGRLVRDALAEIAAGGDARAQDIAVEGGDGVQVRADPAQMSQLVHNIVGNAMKYGHPGTPVSVRIVPTGPQMVELSVSDCGDGIPAEALPRLTERFFRVDSARSRTLGGTGLGLAIVKHVVERHRGRLDIDSIEGQGTTVRVRLPIAAPPV
jgi:two-component system phosphate regulon sensor histidine kinase PhoR